jgi:hypothetical protein
MAFCPVPFRFTWSIRRACGAHNSAKGQRHAADRDVERSPPRHARTPPLPLIRRRLSYMDSYAQESCGCAHLRCYLVLALAVQQAKPTRRCVPCIGGEFKCKTSTTSIWLGLRLQFLAAAPHSVPPRLIRRRLFYMIDHDHVVHGLGRRELQP